MPGHAAVDDFEEVVVGVEVCGFWLGEEVGVFGGEHDVGGLEVAVNHLV